MTAEARATPPRSTHTGTEPARPSGIAQASPSLRRRAEPASSGSGRADHLPSRRALVVDDDRLSRTVLQDALAGRGYQVVTAEDGLAGASALVDEILQLDVLVTDLRMPGMDGEQLISWIRKAGGERDLAIVVVTGAGGRDEARLREAGADAVLDKESGLDAIADVVDLVASAHPQAHIRVLPQG